MSNHNTGISPAALLAFLGGDLENFLVAATPGGIEAQEKAGQAQLVSSSRFPIDMQPSREAYEAVGFAIARRARRIANLLKGSITGGQFWIAGGCLNGDTFNDVDIFPIPLNQVPSVKGTVLARTKNAVTYKLKNGTVVQVCHYKKNTLEELLESFDYAHTQVGAMLIGADESVEGKGEVGYGSSVAYTEAFVEAMASGHTWYTGSEYPLSSLIRAAKYRDRMTRGEYTRTVLECIADVVSRGFTSYDDFKDQLDAVDLGLLPDDLTNTETALGTLYERLSK